MEAVLEQAAVFERAAGPRLLRAERLVLAWPDLFGDALLSADLGIHAQGPMLLAIGRFKAARWGPDAAARFRFWTSWTGGAEVALSDLGLLQRANFLARLERCELRKNGLAPAQLGAGFDGLLAGLGVQRTRQTAEPVRAQLEVDLGDRRTCSFDASTHCLFIVSNAPPAIGDTMALQLTVPGRPGPFAVEAKVTLARMVPNPGRGQPAGFGLTLQSCPGLLEAIAGLAQAPAVERRASARYSVKAPVALSAPTTPVMRQAYASPGALLKDYAENLSIGGAFIRTAHPLPLHTQVTLELELFEGELLRAAGTVVNVMATGIGIHFRLEPAAKARLEQSIARLRGSPAPSSAPELFKLRYGSIPQLQAELPSLLAGGVFLGVDRSLPLQTPVRLELELPDGVVHLLRGKVVSTEPAGLGVELDLEPWSRERLKETLARHARAPEPPVPPPSLVELLERPDSKLAGGGSRLSVVDLIEDAPSPGPPPFGHDSFLSALDALEVPPPRLEAKRPAQLGNYELLSLLGRGGMAEVFYARVVAGPRAGEPVAIKRLSEEMANRPEAVELFMGEVDILRMLAHPNIVKTLEVGTLGSQYYLVMEAIDGRNLGQILRRCRERKIFLPVDLACLIARSLLAGLESVHCARGRGGAPLEIVHCDVSPENLFVSRDGEIKLGDFGLSQRAGPAGQGGTVGGKAAYLSPEALAGEVSAGRDLWAANVTLYELLTLQIPFLGATVAEQFDAIRRGRWEPAEALRPGLAPGLCAVVARGFEKDPRRRFQSASQFADALSPHCDPAVGTALAIAALVRGLFGQTTSQS